MPQPYEVLVRLNPADGKVVGASVRYAEKVGERVFELDPQPLSGVDDPAFAVFAKAFSTAALAERDEALAAAVAACKATVAEMEAKLASNSRQWNVDLTPLRALIVSAMAAKNEVSPSVAFAAFVNAALDSAGLADADAMWSDATDRLLAAPADVQAKALTVLGADELIGAEPKRVADRLKRFGKDLYLALPEETRNELVMQVNGK